MVDDTVSLEEHQDEARCCPDCGTSELARHSYEECCAVLKQQLLRAEAVLAKLRAPSDAVCEEALLNETGYDWPVLIPMIVAAAEREVKEDAS